MCVIERFQLFDCEQYKEVCVGMCWYGPGNAHSAFGTWTLPDVWLSSRETRMDSHPENRGDINSGAKLLELSYNIIKSGILG